MNAEEHRPARAYAVRGNVYSFHMPRAQITQSLCAVLEADDPDVLPHPSDRLASMVLFSLRVGDVVDLSKWLPRAKLRPHVVLKLCPLFPWSTRSIHFRCLAGEPQRLKDRCAELLATRYPGQELHLPEDERECTTPEPVAAAMREGIGPLPGQRESGLRQKHATPLVAPAATSVVLENARPASLFPDRNSSNIVQRDAQELLTLRKHYMLNVHTEQDLVVIWKRVHGAGIPVQHSTCSERCGLPV